MRYRCTWFKNRWAGHRHIFQRYMSRVEHKSANSDILTFLRSLHKDYFDYVEKRLAESCHDFISRFKSISFVQLCRAVDKRLSRMTITRAQ